MKTKLLLTCLMASTTIPATVLAQTANTADATDIGRVSAEGSATTAPSVTTGPSATGVTRQEVGGGLMVDEVVSKSKSSVTRDFIQKQQPSADVFQILKYAPGANAAAGDAYGLNQGLISVRGLEGGQLGFNFEGLPLNVASNWSVFPGQWIDTENTDVVTLNQGTADLGSPNANATGGVVDLFLHTPSKEAGGMFDVSYGTSNARRIFIRGETGLVKDTGVRAFISYSHIDADHFRGPGKDTKDHIDLAVLKEFSGGSKTKLALTYSEIVRDTYKNPTLAQWQADGAKGASTNYNSTYTTNDTSYYKLLKNPWRNLLMSVPTEIKVDDAMKVSVTPYLFYGYGGSGSATVLNESSVAFGNTRQAVDLNNNGTTTDTNVLVYNPILERNTRVGATAKVDYTYKNHALVAGVWFQKSRDELYRPYSTTNSDGTASDYRGESNYIRTTDGRIVNGWDQDTRDRFASVFVGDTISLMEDRLAIDVGVKQMFLKREGINRVPTDVPNTETSRNPMLPSLAARYRLDDYNTVFASFGKGYRIIPAGSLYPRYNATTGAVTTRANPDQPSETSTSLEFGYRYQTKLLSLSTSVFNYDFNNRQISASVCDPSCVNSPINGGKQTARGLDFEVGLRPIKNFRPYVSMEYLHTEIKSDIPVGGDYLPTTGKQAVRAPKWQAAVATDYDDGRLFGNLGVKFVSSQYSTFMNDQKMPGYTTADATIGFRMNTMGTIKKPELRLNLLNILNRQYLSGVYSPTTNALATTGRNGNSIAGSSPSYLIANGFTAVLTFAAAF